MGSILLCSTPLHAHVTPLLQVARHLVGHGHDVRFLTGTRFATEVTSTGAVHLTLPAEADFDDRDFSAAFPEAAGLRGWARRQYEITAIFVAPMLAQLAAVDAALADGRPDAILADVTFAGAAAMATRPTAARPPLIAMGVMPLMTSDPDVAPFGTGLAPMRGRLGVARNRSIALAAQKLVLAPCQRAVDAHTVEATGRRLGVFFTDWTLRADALLQFSVPGFEYPRREAQANLRFAGPVPSGSDGPLPTWWDEVCDGRPIVHVSQGALANGDFAQLIEPTITGLGQDDCWIIISTGGRPLRTLPDALPDNVRASTWLPYPSVLPRLAAFVSNGGFGSVQSALEHGVPLVVAPSDVRAREVAARVAWTGSGIDLRTSAPSAELVAKAVRHVLADFRFAAMARDLALEISEAPGLSAIDECIDQLTRSPAQTH